ncbi:SusC/RagA family TonB-linked outer membrane protein [Spongiivirga citrea]|uniref:SusC/RagA family TonB-linked outer membrane protein n=1 Tax=Spongiivirga citrea TaxID=1481457 RepID=A0A6M0CLC4_9FLAO|nr:TonB-dependent receptor [Spongiivirga citrea]NER17783.1 SusC/RagA family TonB-linked outer membrane protein [Spongiivirga citrea]
MKLKNLWFILFLIVSGQVMGQEVAGTVTANEGPLPGASVFVKGTNNGVVTDFDGKYKLKNVKNRDILVFSYLGFKSQEVTYTGQEEINVELVEDLVSLDEVVIVTYGTQRNTPVSVVSSESLSEFPTTDIGQALQGRAAGVTITNGGSPGSQTLVQIRGVNTFGDGTPLYVVDGVFTNSINSVDLASVEKIDILKDAASLAVYGSRGTNGVVLITTKKGRVGKASFKLEASTGIQEFNRRYDVLNTTQYIQFLREINALAGQPGGPDFPVGRVNLNPLFNGNGIDTDWQDAYFQQAPIYNISASVNGGSEKARFNLSLSRLEQDGVYVDTGFSRTTLNINTDANIADWLEIGQTLSLGYNETVSPEFEGGRDPLQNIIGQAPYVSVVTENGLFGGTNSSDLNDSRNQLRVQSSQDNLARFSSIIGSVYTKLNLAKGLSLRSQFGLNANLLRLDNERRAFEEAGERFVSPINFIDKTRQTVSQTILTNTLSYDREFGKHSVNASAVLEQTRIRFESASISDNNEVSSNIPEAFSPNARATSFSVPENLNSVLFLAGYGFDDRYSISASGRRDTSSRFAPENASQWFFSGALGWDISNEPFFKIEDINSLKLRASYGETGNNRTGNAVNQFLPTLGLNLPVSIDDETSPGITPNNAANPDLRWETQIKQNYGLTMAFLYDQIQFGVDYFKNRSEDLLIPVELPSSSGIPGNSQTGSTVIRNVGVVDVKGLEFTVGYNDYKGDFKWNLWANVTKAESIVESLGASGEPIERARLNPPFASALNRLAVDEAPFHFFGLVADGVFSTQEQIDNELPNNGAAAVPVQPGDVRFLDINGDGQISLEDRQVIGNPNPDFTYALNLRAEYKGWDFDVLFNGVQGVDVLNSNVFYLEGLDNGLNYGTQVLRRWQNPGDITDIPRFRFGSNINNEISTRYIEDGSYLRLRNVTVGYTFPDKLINKSGKSIVKKLRFYVQGQNLLTFTNYSGLDPEIAPFYNAQGLVDGLGIDRSAQPRPITVLSGIQIEF